MHNSGKWITGIVFVLFFCTAAGYTGLASTKISGFPWNGGQRERGEQ
jgi:hypothetical protein